MKVTDRGVSLIKRFEGYHKKLADGRAAPYLDPVGIPTIGYGTTTYNDGTRVSLDDPPITRGTAEDYLEQQINMRYAPAVERSFKFTLHNWSTDALISLCYNIGTGAYGRSTLTKRLRERDWDSVAREWRKWRLAGGEIMQGLVRRREAELELFREGLAAMGTNKLPDEQPEITGEGKPPIPGQRQSRRFNLWAILKKVWNWIKENE